MIKVLIKSDSRYPVDRKRVRKVVKDFLEKEMGVEAEMKVGVVMIGDRKMKELNKKYLKRDYVTDVLSFSQMEEGDGEGEVFFDDGVEESYLGDVVVCWPQAVRQSLERQVLVDDEVDFLVKHGLLHLMGIHHD